MDKENEEDNWLTHVQLELEKMAIKTACMCALMRARAHMYL